MGIAMSVNTGNSPPGWPINNEVLVDLGRRVERGDYAFEKGDVEWLVAACNDLSNALDEERDKLPPFIFMSGGVVQWSVYADEVNMVDWDEVDADVLDYIDQSIDFIVSSYGPEPESEEIAGILKDLYEKSAEIHATGGSNA